MATFESQNRRMPKIEACLKANGLESLDACNEMLLAKGIDCDKIIRGIQPICFDNAVWAYTLGTAIAVCSIVFNRTIAGKSYIYPLIPFSWSEVKKRFLRGRLPHTEKRQN